MLKSLPFLCREALINLRRHGLMTMAAISTIAVALLLVGSFVLAAQQVTELSHRTVDAFELRVFCRHDLTDDDRADVKAKLTALPGVARVVYRSSTEAFADATQNLPIDTEGIPNLMPDTFVVKLNEASGGPALAETIRSWSGQVENVDLPEEELKVVVRLVRYLRTLGLLGGVLLLLGALVVVVNTIRLSVFSRRREIKIMQIVGAAPSFIRLPMLIEGLIHGILGGLVAALALTALRTYTDTLLQQVPLLQNYLLPIDMTVFGVELVGVGAVLGFTGSFLSVHRYLKIV